jgi:hypothetical protein
LHCLSTEPVLRSHPTNPFTSADHSQDAQVDRTGAAPERVRRQPNLGSIISHADRFWEPARGPGMAQLPALDTTSAPIITSATLSKPLSLGHRQAKAQYRNPDAHASGLP